MIPMQGRVLGATSANRPRRFNGVPSSGKSLALALARARPAVVRFSAIALLATTTLIGGPPAHAEVPRDDFWLVNGEVRAMQLVDSTLYIGGDFTRISPQTGNAVPFDTRTGLPMDGFPRVRGEVFTIIPGGEGGWFIGGTFTSVGAVPRANLARVLPDMRVADWNPDLGGTVSAVSALTRDGGILYVGGYNYLAAVDACTGSTLPWHAATDGEIGRASCRKRVEGGVGEGAVKKKYARRM